MKIGLFFGSFNPIHTGHLIMANYIANNYVDKIWFVVSPQNPFKDHNELLMAENRLSLVKIAIEKDDRFQASDIEFKLPIPSYTINTLKGLSQQYPDHEFFIIIGSDNYEEITKWKSADEIIKNYKLLIYERPGFCLSKPTDSSIINAPLLNISATEIRKLIRQNKSFKYLVPENVYEAIKKNNYFK
ncbi:MAG: nicotinate (nicotinamide) nucleotide adenylyltransferase [Parafilimonas sp.]